MSLFSSILLLVCTASITSFHNLVFSFSFIFEGIGNLLFFISSTNFSKYVLFLFYCNVIVIDQYFYFFFNFLLVLLTLCNMFFCHLFRRGDACLVLVHLPSFSIYFTTLYKSLYLPWVSSRHKLNIAILILQYFSIVSLFLNEIWYLHSEIVGLPKIRRKIFLTKQIRLYARTNPGTLRKKMLEINIFRQDFLTRQSKIFFYKTLLRNNLTHLLK